jgi:DNA-binding NtrC family response regulator
MTKPNKVLVVDDDDIVRLSYERSLKAANCNVEVETALNGEDALKAMERKPFDVVLLDLRMPGMDGLTVLKSIKRDWPASGIVVITGYPTIESAKEAMRLGACEYLAKPVSPAEIVSAANTAIAQKSWALQRSPADGDGPPAATNDSSEGTSKLAS